MSVVANSADVFFMARLDDYAAGRFFAENGQSGHCFETYHANTFYRPIEQYGDYAPMREAAYDREGAALHARYPKEWDWIRDAVRERGASTVGDLDRGERVRGHWGNQTSLASTLVDAMVQCGVLMVARRERRSKVVDLPERVVPSEHLAPTAAAHEYDDDADAALLRILRHRVWFLGYASNAAAMAELRILKLPRARKQELWDRLGEEPDLRRVRIGEREYLAHREMLERYAGSSDTPDRPDRYRLISPFDPLISDRELVRELFDFDYVFEGYKPKRQRQYGGYTMPVAHRGDLPGRVELARSGTTLRLAHSWAEPDAELDAEALATAVDDLSEKLAAGAAEG